MSRGPSVRDPGCLPHAHTHTKTVDHVEHTQQIVQEGDLADREKAHTINKKSIPCRPPAVCRRAETGESARAGTCRTRRRRARCSPAASAPPARRRRRGRPGKKVASEPGVGAAGTGKEEGVPERAGGEGEGAGEEELGAGGEAVHAAEREPDA